MINFPSANTDLKKNRSFEDHHYLSTTLPISVNLALLACFIYKWKFQVAHYIVVAINWNLRQFEKLNVRTIYHFMNTIINLRQMITIANDITICYTQSKNGNTSDKRPLFTKYGKDSIRNVYFSKYYILHEFSQADAMSEHVRHTFSYFIYYVSHKILHVVWTHITYILSY